MCDERKRVEPSGDGITVNKNISNPWGTMRGRKYYFGEKKGTGGVIFTRQKREKEPRSVKNKVTRIGHYIRQASGLIRFKKGKVRSKKREVCKKKVLSSGGRKVSTRWHSQERSQHEIHPKKSKH